MSEKYISPTLKDSNFTTITVLSNKNNLDHAHKDIELIYVIKGTLQVKTSSTTFSLGSTDYVLINSNQFHSFESNEDNLFVIFHFNYQELVSLLNQDILFFSCNSVQFENIADRELRSTLEELLAVHINKGSIQQTEFYTKLFALFTILSKNYLKVQEKVEVDSTLLEMKADERIGDILTYLQNNYREQLSLNDVANMYYLSVPYLSKFFKKQTGKTFSQYLNEIRLAYSVSDLISTDKPITRIALDNGFPNLAAFNRVFSSTHELKPAEYRKKMAIKNEEKETKNIEINKQEKIEAITELRQYLKNTVNQIGDIERDTDFKRISSSINIKKEKELKKYWNKLINIGYAKDILNSDIQDQLKLLKSEIGFTYARFWGVFGEDMHVEDRSGDAISYNFSNVNKVLDFLVKNKYKPFIELGPKPKILSKSLMESFIMKKNNEKSLEEWQSVIKAFLLNCIKRYGMEEIESWYFEIWNQFTDPGPTKDGNENKYKVEEFEQYYQVFELLKKTIKKMVPTVKVGGCGLVLEVQQWEMFLQQWWMKDEHPDFVSIYLYPHERDRENSNSIKKNTQSSNPNYIRKKTNQVRKYLRTSQFEDIELNITEWNNTISNRDYLNDSCFKSSYIVKNVVENINQVTMIGYWLFSDIFSDFIDSKNLLHGGAGLITKSGIKKPSYYAFSLLNQLGDTLIDKGEGYIVTKKHGDCYRIICYNYKHFDYSYYLHSEASMKVHEQYNFFEDNEKVNISIELDGVNEGKYRKKEIILNRENGSILDEWIKFGAVEDMNQDEVDYLRQICVPYMKVEHIHSDNNVVNVDGILEPHEVRIIELDLVFEEN